MTDLTWAAPAAPRVPAWLRAALEGDLDSPPETGRGLRLVEAEGR